MTSVDPGGLYQNMVASFIDGLVLISPDGTMTETNNAAEEMFRRSRELFLGRPLAELFPDQPEVSEKALETCKNGASFRDIECVGYRRLDQSTFPATVTLSPYLNPDQNTSGALVHVRDCSLTRELEETSRQLDQITRLGVLSLGLAHEIKNPLVAISGSAQLLRSRLDDAEHREFLDVVIKEVQRINRMVERMLGFANSQQPVLKPVNIHKILEEILLLEKQNTEEDIRITQEYDPSLPEIPGDEDQLKQVFLNLIRNAKEAMAKGGSLRVITRFRSDYSVRTKNHPDPHQDIVIELIDNGPGIAKEHLQNLFTPFHTTKPKGNGLGLPISLKIVENHHGKIKVLSREGEGTTVQVFLPVQSGIKS